jgi:hypothetical protein
MLKKPHWVVKDLAGYCQVCGEPIYNMVYSENKNLTNKRWMCEHQNADRVIK